MKRVRSRPGTRLRVAAALGGLTVAFLAGATPDHAARGAPAAPEPGELLQASEAADQHVSYTGSKLLRVFRPGDPTPAQERLVKVWHRAPDQTRVEVVQPAESLGVVLLDTGGQSWMFSPRAQRWQPMRYQAPQPRPGLFLRNYEVQLVRKERVADRRVYVLRVVSRHSGSLSKMVWIDMRTKVPLRQELYDAAGNLAVASEFREISFESSMPANLFTLPVEVRPGVRKERSGEGDLLKPGVSVAQPRYVPAGYQLVCRMSYRGPGRDIAHLRWTDGLNTISLFQERGDAPKQHPGGQKAAGFASEGARGPRSAARGGAMNCGHRLVWTRGETRFVLMGNVSLSELKRMAESLPDGERPAPGGSALR